MKFGKQLELGCYEPWKAHYCAYARLKRIIKRNTFVRESIRNKRRGSRHNDMAAAAAAAVLSAAPSDANGGAIIGDMELVDESTPLTQSNLTRLSGSYVQEGGLGGLTGQGQPSHNYSDRDLESLALLRSPGRADRRQSHTSNYSSGTGNSGSGNENIEDFYAAVQDELDKVNGFFQGKIAELKVNLDHIVSKRNNVYFDHHTGRGVDTEQLRHLYVELSTLRMFCSLNQTAFVKIIKKHDKVFEECMLQTWSDVIDKQPFSVSPEPVQCMDIIQDMVSRERLMEWDRQSSKNIGPVNKDDVFPAVKGHMLLFSVIVFLVSLNIPLVSPSSDHPGDVHVGIVTQYPTATAPGRCLAVLLFVVSLWLSEAIPYYATSIMIAPLCVVMDVFKDPTNSHLLLNREDAAKMVMGNFVNHTSMLLMGGFAISAAFSRCQLELRVAAKLQKWFKDTPRIFILAIMLLGLFLSMWISNHTAPILVGTIVTPIVRDLPRESRFGKTLLLGLAYACNFGGMITPISSLQNALAVSVLEHTGIEIGFGQWIVFGLPFALCCTLVAWVMLIVVCKPDDVQRIPVIVYERDQKAFSKRNVVVLCLSFVTVVLFAASSYLKTEIGDISTISLVFVATIFGSGMLTEVDFNGLPFHIIFLLGGGTILGKAVESSGLLKDIAVAITDVLPLNDRLLAMLTIFTFAGVVATFVSHTVAALILMPIISQVGVSLEAPAPLVIGTALSVSAAMALPFSSFPNVNSLLITDDFRNTYLTVYDFIRTGLPLSVVCVLAVTLCAWCDSFSVVMP